MFWRRIASLVKFYTNQIFFLLSAEKPRSEFSATVWAAVFPVKSRKIDDNLEEAARGDKGKQFTLFVPSFTLSPYSARLCAPCGMTIHGKAPTSSPILTVSAL